MTAQPERATSTTLKTCSFVFALAAILSGGCSDPASRTYPSKDIEIVIPYSTGGGFDAYIRALSPHIEKHLPNGVNVLPINSPGAGGRRGANQVYRAKPDGYTIGVFNLPGVLMPQLQGMPVHYDLAEMTWLATLSIDSYAYVVKADSPLDSMDDVRSLGRPIVYGATGPSSTAYIATTLVNEAMNISYEVVTGYRGSSDYVLGVIRGDVDAALANLSTVDAYLKSGELKMLAVIGSESDDPAISDADDLGIPAMGNIRITRMIAAPPGLPKAEKAILEKAILAALGDPGFEAWLESTGNDGSPAGADETARSLGEMARFYAEFKQYLQ